MLSATTQPFFLCVSLTEQLLLLLQASTGQDESLLTQRKSETGLFSL